MKRLGIIVLTVLLSIGVLAGCGSQETQAPAEKDVTITVPRDMFADQSEEEIRDRAAAEGMDAAIDAADVTFTMTAETQQKILLGIKTQFEEDLAAVLDNGEVPGLLEVTYNDEMSVFTVTVAPDQFQMDMEEPQLGLLYSTGTAYQLYAGKDEEAIDVTIELVAQGDTEPYDSFGMREVFTAQQSPGDNSD